MMKTLLAALPMLLVAMAAWAQTEPAAPPAKFAEHKTEAIARIQERIAKEQAVLTCVQAAQNHAAMKACMPARPPGAPGAPPAPAAH